ncbi:DoxX family protein [Flavobacterium hydrophilum]|uniref:DoxX family protein n=1 Tax=Flavobacterium hydrophilum TaxID=2211445 RepID=A0A2V4BWQ0_9FLAO|nr:DoxX family protein [Flavobacterium hydrophilum]PXY43052.1 hypothetical protein DMB68_21885 [Flavobacterium hydrophilum]
MEDQQHSKAIRITLWLVQIILALSFIWGGSMKLFQSIEKLSAMWPWTAQVSPVFLKFTAIVDLLAGIGIVVPTLLLVNPKCTRMIAFGVIVLMICASIFHICRDEASQIGINIFFALLAAFVMWGRK